MSQFQMLLARLRGNLWLVSIEPLLGRVGGRVGECRNSGNAAAS